MDQSRCKYRLRSKGSLTNVTQPPPGFSGRLPASFRCRGRRPVARRAVVDQRGDAAPVAVGIREICRRRGRRTAGRHAHRGAGGVRSVPTSAAPAGGGAGEPGDYFYPRMVHRAPTLLARSHRRQASRSIRRAWLCPEIRRQEAKQPFGDEFVALRCPMAASGGVPVGRRAVKGYVWDARSLKVTNQGDVG